MTEEKKKLFDTDRSTVFSSSFYPTHTVLPDNHLPYDLFIFQPLALIPVHFSPVPVCYPAVLYLCHVKLCLFGAMYVLDQLHCMEASSIVNDNNKSYLEWSI